MKTKIYLFSAAFLFFCVSQLFWSESEAGVCDRLFQKAGKVAALVSNWVSGLRIISELSVKSKQRKIDSLLYLFDTAIRTSVRIELLHKLEAVSEEGQIIANVLRAKPGEPLYPQLVKFRRSRIKPAHEWVYDRDVVSSTPRVFIENPVSNLSEDSPLATTRGLYAFSEMSDDLAEDLFNYITDFTLASNPARAQATWTAGGPIIENMIDGLRMLQIYDKAILEARFYDPQYAARAAALMIKALQKNLRVHPEAINQPKMFYIALSDVLAASDSREAISDFFATDPIHTVSEALLFSKLNLSRIRDSAIILGVKPDRIDGFFTELLRFSFDRCRRDFNLRNFSPEVLGLANAGLYWSDLASHSIYEGLVHDKRVEFYTILSSYFQFVVEKFSKEAFPLLKTEFSAASEKKPTLSFEDRITYIGNFTGRSMTGQEIADLQYVLDKEPSHIERARRLVLIGHFEPAHLLKILVGGGLD